jgi:hypothetical protein
MKEPDINANSKSFTEKMHQIVLLMVVIWLASFVTFFIACKRVSDHPKFAGGPWKSLSLDTEDKK